MANITDVKLPDNSQYDLKDNVSGYAKKVSGATTDDLASLTATGDLADSGKKLSDLVLKSDVKDVLNSTSTTDALSANQGRVLADNLAANENVYGAKNTWDYNQFVIGNGGFTQNSGVYTNTLTDTRPSFHLMVKAFDSISTDLGYVINEVTTGTGIKEFPASIPSNTAYLRIAHNGLTQDFTFLQPITQTGDVIFSFNVTSNDPTTVGGLSFTDVMLRDARILDPTFAPYAETNLQLTRKTSGLSNENLLDNPWFTVNQRGVTSGGFDASYKMDRWQSFYTSNTSGAWSLSSSGLSIDTTNVSSGNNYFAQTFRASLDTSKLYTASVMLSDGTVLSGVITSFPTSLAVPFGSLYITATDITITIGAGATVTIRAVKLELGSVSTLANDVAPNYTTELLKCQRYFLCIEGLTNGAVLGLGTPNSATTMYTAVPLPTPMRATPTLSYAGTGHILQGGSTMALTNITIDTISNVYAQIIVVSSGLTIGQVGMLRASSGGLKIFLSADL